MSDNLTSSAHPHEITSETESYFQWLRGGEGGFATEVKTIDDGLFAATKPLLFHWTLIVGEIGNKFNYLNRWCYATQEEAESALRKWDGNGEPEGWNRHPGTGRRRPDGDSNKEYINY